MSRHAYQGTFKDLNGSVVGSLTTADGNAGTITVYLAGGTTAADVYTASSGGAAVNSVSTDTYGHFIFYVDDSEYMPTQLFKIILSHGDFQSKTYDNLRVITDDPYKYYCDATATDQGAATTRLDRSLYDLIATISTDSADIVLPNSGSGTTTYTVTTSDAIPSNINLIFENGAIIDGAGTLTFDNPGQIIAAPNQQIFGSSITLVFTNSGDDYPGWWGDPTSVNVDKAADALAASKGGQIICLSTTYTITTAIALARGVNLIGTHTPNQDNPSDVKANGGTIFNRTADVAVITLTGTHRVTDRWGKNLISGIAFDNNADVASEAIIDAELADNVIVEKCSFWEDDTSTTVGHMIDCNECWDWTLRDSIFKQYGNAGGTKHAVLLYDGAVSQTNSWNIQNCRFYNGKGKAIVSDMGGASALTRQSFFNIDNCKFEDSSYAALDYISGPFSHLSITNSWFLSGNGNAIVTEANSFNYNIIGNTFLGPGDTPTEWIEVVASQRIRIISNHFSGIGAAMTRFIHIEGAGGGQLLETQIENNTFYETVLGTTAMVAFTGTIHPSVSIKDNGDYQNETVTTGSPALMTWQGYTKLDSSGGAITATLGSGIKIGDIKTIVMSEATTSSTVTVALHDDVDGIPAYDGSTPSGDAIAGTFNALDETWILMWTGTEWTTLRATCTFV